MNALEKLIANPNLLKLPRKEIEMKRLTEDPKDPFIITIRALSMSETDAIIKRFTDQNGLVDNAKVGMHLIATAIVEPNLNDATLKQAFGIQNGAEFVEKFLVSGEIEGISEQIQLLSGTNTKKNKLIEEVKNK